MSAGLDLARVSVADLDLAARGVIEGALGVRAAEHVVVIGDASSVRMADALARAVGLRGAVPVSVWLDEGRPSPTLPAQAREALLDARASVFVASAEQAELPMRQELLAMVKARRMRHAHMPSISHLAFARGLRVDYDVVAGHGMRLMGRLARASEIVARSERGTELRVRMPERARWLPQLGQLEPGRWGNLPAGAIYAAPASVDGTFVADAALAPDLEAPAGTEVNLMIVQSYVVQVEVPGLPELERELRCRLSSGPNAERIGLIAIGVNYGIGEATGEALVDQNLPGLHLAVGDPAADVMGGGWRAPTSLPFCQARSTVLLDGEAIVRRGALVEPS